MRIVYDNHTTGLVFRCTGLLHRFPLTPARRRHPDGTGDRGEPSRGVLR